MSDRVSSPFSSEKSGPSRSRKKATSSIPDGPFLPGGTDPSGQSAAPTPEAYDDYYLLIVKECLRYGCPVGGILFVSFFATDASVSGAAGAVLIKTLALRLVCASVLFAFWFIAPRLHSPRVMMASLSGLYLFTVLDFIAIMRLLPQGLVLGVPGLVLVTMSACGLFCLRPAAGAICGPIGLLAYVGASLSAGLARSEVVIGATQFAAAQLLGVVFLVLLDREFRKRHALERSLESEKAQSETLLKEILPRYVIQRIREGAQSIADSILEVNVMFIDIVGFTEMSRRLAPKHLVEVLGQTFQSFDDKCEAYGVTKIKVIGDAYMAITGLSDSSSRSAIAAIEFCMEALRSVKEVGSRTGMPIRVRIGVATGAVISGVLSLKRPSYDLWGETVNLAAQMESSSEPGRIQIAETTYWRVKHKFACEPRTRVAAKGLGSVQTYFVSHARPAREEVSGVQAGAEPRRSEIQSGAGVVSGETVTIEQEGVSAMQSTDRPFASEETPPDRHERIQELFLGAIELQPEQRGAFFEEACAGDTDLLVSIQRLIDAGTQTPALLRKQDGDRSMALQLPPGKELAGRFRIVRFIAAGGMGDVYEVEDLQLGERLAIKTIRPEVVHDARAIARFKREIQYAKRVTHPNVCRIHDLGSHREGASEIVFLTMELLHGLTLAEHMRTTGPMTAASALLVITHMADALSAAHEAGIIHRDFKPSNVILTNSAAGRKAVVTDFGLARSWLPEGDASLTDAGQMVGTLAYMAPEQLSRGEATPSTDVYALGLVIYEMLTGHRPFEGGTPIDAVVRKLSGSPPPALECHVTGLDARWDAAVLACLQREPARRPQKPEEVIRTLKAGVEGAQGGS
jgi:class 3 adenylate cyclase